MLTIVDVDATIAAELASRASDVVQLVREALSNVGRHADATTCRVALRRADNHAELEIDDDGRGFDPTMPSDGMGMANLRDRVTSLGGEIGIESSIGVGTTVRILLPLTARAAGARRPRANGTCVPAPTADPPRHWNGVRSLLRGTADGT